MASERSNSPHTPEVAAVIDGLMAKYLWRQEEKQESAIGPAAFLSAVPVSGTFGVFATVKRGEKIHGCMGSWVKGFKAISAERILARARTALFQAIFEDPRRFKTPVWQDPSAVVEITLMLGPVVELAEASAEASAGSVSAGSRLVEGPPPHLPASSFSPSEHGIIVECASATATFLPGVFGEETSLDEIKRKLVEKAGGELKGSRFYTYTGKRLTSRMQDLVMYSLAFTSGPAFVASYISFITEHTRQAVSNDKPPYPPYAVDEEGRVSVDEMQHVRNAGAVADVLDFGGSSDWAQAYLAHHFKDLDLGATSAQAVSFVAHHLPLVTPACHLMQRVLLSLDSTFALPEVLLGLHRTRCHTKTSTLPRAMTQLRGAIESMDVARNPSACFALNWASQVAALYRDAALLVVVSSQWLAWIAGVFDRTRAALLESNELVVTFEGLTHMILAGRSRPEFVRVWMACLFAALSRIQPATGLIAFTTHTARLDITSHLVRAIQHTRRITSPLPTSHHPAGSAPHPPHLGEVARDLLRSRPSTS